MRLPSGTRRLRFHHSTERHRLAEHQAQAVHQQVAERHVGRAVQRQRQRNRAAQIGRAEQRNQPDIEQHRRAGGERLGAERIQAAQQRQTLEHDEHAGIAWLQRAAEARQHAGDQRRRAAPAVRRPASGRTARDRAGWPRPAGARAGRDRRPAPPAARCRSRRTPAAGRRTTCRCPAAGTAVHQAQPSTAATKNGMAVYWASIPSTLASWIGIAEIHTISGGLISTTST